MSPVGRLEFGLERIRTVPRTAITLSTVRARTNVATSILFPQFPAGYGSFQKWHCFRLLLLLDTISKKAK